MKINFKGFSLVEVMIGTGIAAALVLVIASSLKQTAGVKSGVQKSSDVNNLIQMLTSELTRKEVCERNFKGLNPVAGTLANLRNKYGKIIIATAAPYGDYINNISLISYNGAASPTIPRLFKMNLSVQYTPRPKPGVAAVNKQFTIPINVFLDNAGNVDTCYSDVQSLMENAVKFSCAGNGAKYYPKGGIYPYGRCEHEAELVDSLGAVVTICPPGELVQLIDRVDVDLNDINDIEVATPRKMTFRCSKLNTQGVVCNDWEYMKGIKDDGSADCVDLRTIFNSSVSGTGVIVSRSPGVYIAQVINCPANQILQRINAAGVPVCVNPRFTLACAPGQYATIDAGGNPTCAFSTNSSACPAQRYIRQINAVGDVICGDTIVPGASCPLTHGITAIDATGAAVCSPIQP